MTALPIPTLQSVPEPDADADPAPVPATETLACRQDPATPLGTAPVFSSADDMDFDIVSTRR